jgi:hydrogenase expression/formation protein HypE
MVDVNRTICPTPLFHEEFIVLGHGSGGKLTANLVNDVFMPLLSNEHLAAAEDAADLDVLSGRCAVTTDSYVVHPIFFPGGDIGSLAVHGTVNDLAVRGAIARYLTASFILEEGLAVADLKRVVHSMAAACQAANVKVVAADTKVVNKGAGDKLFINTTGVGQLAVEPPPAAARVQVGDVVIVSGDIGRHGIAIMCERAGLELDSTIESDSCSLLSLCSSMLETVPDLHCMRDLTRGGLGTILNEVASAASVSVEISENLIHVSEPVRGACELLGLDPLYVACEGRLVTFVSAVDSDTLLSHMRSHPDGREAAIIGRVTENQSRKVVMRSAIGGRRIVDKLSGEQLPRIC